MDDLVRKVMNYSVQGGLFERGDAVVAGVSGGADSVCLLRVLCEIREEMSLDITVVHVNHGLRGEAADEDEHFVEKMCEELDVPCVCFETDVRALARERHMTEEEAGRAYRYECFEQVRRETGADKIAVAHNRDDEAETVLMNLFRGSGVRGMAGIGAVRGNIIRPLLGTGRDEIEKFLEREQIPYRTDATNFDTEYTRNRIRLDVLPYVKEHINAKASEHIAQTAMLTSDVYSYIEREAARAGESIIRWYGTCECCEIDAEGFLKLDAVIQRELVRQAVGRLAGKLKDIERVHIENVRGLFEGQVGKKTDLPYELEAVRTYTAVRILHRTDSAGAGSADTAYTAKAAGEETSPGEYSPAPGRADSAGADAIRLDDGREVVFTLKEAHKNQQIPKNIYTKWFDYAKISGRLILRHRRPGDYMMISGGRKKPIRRILIDDKIPAGMRDSLLLAADGSHIVWIVDTGRISEYYKVTDDTEQILEGCIYYGREDQNPDSGK